MRAAALVLMVALASGCGSTDSSSNEPVSSGEPVATQSLHVTTSDTGPGISNLQGGDRQHYIIQPASEGRQNKLVLFLGGALSTPSNYTTIADTLGSLGLAVVDLHYPDGRFAGVACRSDDNCYTNFRGESVFGSGVAYASGAQTYNSYITSVDAENSIVGRTVAVIDYMANLGGDWNRAYWQQFLVADASSPYSGAHTGPAYPNWSKIIVSGHSQGGGDAAFIGMRLPKGRAVQRVVMLSAPNDNVRSATSASWISGSSTTPLDRFYGMRATDEGMYGSFVSTNWSVLGGAGGVGGSGEADLDIADGSGDPQGAHRLVLQNRGTALSQHDSTALDDRFDRFPEHRAQAWKYLFTGE